MNTDKKLCSATTKKGERCTKPARVGGDMCATHRLQATAVVHSSVAAAPVKAIHVPQERRNPSQPVKGTPHAAARRRALSRASKRSHSTRETPKYLGTRRMATGSKPRRVEDVRATNVLHGYRTGQVLAMPPLPHR